jgi:hypothetical protein
LPFVTVCREVEDLVVVIALLRPNTEVAFDLTDCGDVAMDHLHLTQTFQEPENGKYALTLPQV